jgi:hypothetical protein
VTPEQVSNLSVAGADKILDSRIARWGMTSEELRLLRAQRTFWHRAGLYTLQQLIAFYEAEPIVREEQLSKQERITQLKAELAELEGNSNTTNQDHNKEQDLEEDHSHRHD